MAISSTYTSAFPDFPMPAEYPDYPTWWQVRDYLRSYAEVHRLCDRITFNTAVTWVKPEGVGWTATTDDRRVPLLLRHHRRTRHRVAPGHARPGRARSTSSGQVWHSARYAAPAELAGKRVLVVGAGNSGAEIACDAARSGAIAYLSVRRGHRLRPPPLRRRADRRRHRRRAAAPGRPDARPPDSTELVDALTGDVRRLGLPPPDLAVWPGHPTVNATC